MIQEGGARICMYMRSEVRSVGKRDKGPMAGRKYILGSGNGVRRDNWKQVWSPERSESPYITPLLRFVTRQTHLQKILPTTPSASIITRRHTMSAITRVSIARQTPSNPFPGWNPF